MYYGRVLRILPILTLVLVTAGFITWKVYFSNKTNAPISLPGNFSINSITPKESSDSAIGVNPLEDRVKELEITVTNLLKNKSTVTNTEVKALQTSIDDLKTRVSKLETGSSTTTSSSTSTSTSTGAQIAYIPIGYTGSLAGATNYGNVTGHEVTINTSNYPGYKNMTLEVNFRLFQGNGTAYVRLANKTDGTSFSSSEVSTTSQDYATKTSGSFTLPVGSKTYTVQAKSTTGYSVDLQWSRIRVDF